MQDLFAAGNLPYTLALMLRKHVQAEEVPLAEGGSAPGFAAGLCYVIVVCCYFVFQVVVMTGSTGASGWLAMAGVRWQYLPSRSA